MCVCLEGSSQFKVLQPKCQLHVAGDGGRHTGACARWAAIGVAGIKVLGEKRTSGTPEFSWKLRHRTSIPSHRSYPILW